MFHGEKDSLKMLFILANSRDKIVTHVSGNEILRLFQDNDKSKDLDLFDKIHPAFTSLMD